MTDHAHVAYIGLGSNLDNPMQQVSDACNELSQHASLNLQKVSSWYRSKAVGPGEQADYVNGAALVTTSMSPQELLECLQHIEQRHHRVRELRWGPRTLDLDILLYNDWTVDTDNLTIPHIELANRNFVVLPLLDIQPDLQLPDGRRLVDILTHIGRQNIEKIA